MEDKTINNYDASDIEVLEGLEAVRMRPGMYIGGTDKHALHHLIVEILDNAMDEAVEGHASRIEVSLKQGNRITIVDNGRGIPIEPHPKFPDKSALEVIFTTLHAGGKFSNKNYATSGGLNGVGTSVVNALSSCLLVEVFRNKNHYRQEFAKGVPISKLDNVGPIHNKRGTSVTFIPDTEIFGSQKIIPHIVYDLLKSRASIHKGVEIRWECDEELLQGDDAKVPSQSKIHFPRGLVDYLENLTNKETNIIAQPFNGEANFSDSVGKIEWAISWSNVDNTMIKTWCNGIATPLGGTHESGLKAAMLRSIKQWGELVNNKNAAKINIDDLSNGGRFLLSAFIPNPQFMGQTKEKLTSPEASKLVETTLRDRLDLWLSSSPEQANIILNNAIERAEQRLKRKNEKKTARQTATKRLRLPGKLTDCSQTNAKGSEVFLVEGDSAGGSAKQARNRKTQAILPLRGKILNVASATGDKIHANQEINDMIEALGCGYGKNFNIDNLRYERVIIMTDADVDGAHIASLLMTFFFRLMPELVKKGHLYLACPPLYRITQGSKSEYAMDEEHKDELMKTKFKGNGKINISRFKGLGEMPPNQLKETTMDPKTRILERVILPPIFDEYDSYKTTEELVETLMGKKAEGRFIYIQENAQFIDKLDI